MGRSKTDSTGPRQEYFKVLKTTAWLHVYAIFAMGTASLKTICGNILKHERFRGNKICQSITPISLIQYSKQDPWHLSVQAKHRANGVIERYIAPFREGTEGPSIRSIPGENRSMVKDKNLLSGKQCMAKGWLFVKKNTPLHVV